MASKGLHIDRWIKGMVTNRAATTTPYRVTGLGNVIRYNDALIDGSNVEITPSNTLARRPGYPKYCTASFTTEVPKSFYSGIVNSVLYRFLNTDQNVYTFDGASLTSIYTKGTTAQSFFQQVGNYVFFSDGNANKKFTTDSSGNVLVTNNGVAAPTAAPYISNLNLYDTVGATQTVHAWVPNATYVNSTASPQNYFIEVPTGEIYWMVVPAGTTLQSQSSTPAWSSKYGTIGATITDGGVTWTNCGTIGAWQANTGSPTYFNSNYATTSILSGGPNAAGTLATSVFGGSVINWTVSGTSASFPAHGSISGNSNNLNFSNFGFAIPSGATIKGVVATIQKTCSFSSSLWDANVQLMKAGVAGGTNKAVTTQHWAQNVFTTYSYGANNDLWGNTLTPTDVNNSGFGFTLRAGVTTTGSSLTANVRSCTITVYYTIAGTISATYTSSVILDSNGNLQRVKVLGTTGNSTPSWSTTIGGTTTDNTMTWECLGTGNQLPCLFNRTYAYGYHTASGHISTMSPTLVVQAPIIGLNVPITGAASADTGQVDRNDLYRSADGGSLLLYDASIGADGSGNPWTINDSALDINLNEEIVGPVALANAPPPSGATLLAYHMGRLWAAVGNLLYFSAGPDCVNGDGMQAWPPANVFTFTGPINGLAATSAGLVVFTAGDISVVLGGPQKETFWVQPIRKNFGIQSPNCLAQDGDTLIAFTSSAQMFSFSADGQEEIGFDVAPTLAANFAPASAYVAIHRSGQDQGIFISDGSSKIQRYNLNANSWDPIATITGGIGPLGSFDTAIGTRSLLSTTGSFIVSRDPTTFSDSGSAYAAYATVGSLVLSELGEETVSIKSLLLSSAAVGSALTLDVLPNEISGSFTNIPLSNSDPAKLSGTVYQSSTINMKEYQWLGAASPIPQWLRHLQVKITLPATDTVKNEIYALALV